MGSKQSAEVDEKGKEVNSTNSSTALAATSQGGRRTRRKRSMKRRHCSHRHIRGWRHKRSQRRR